MAEIVERGAQGDEYLKVCLRVRAARSDKVLTESPAMCYWLYILTRYRSKQAAYLNGGRPSHPR